MEATQAERLAAPFPADQLDTLPKGPGLTYVGIANVLTRITEVVDDFEILNTDAWRDPLDPDWVIGKATIRATIDGRQRTSCQYGGQEINRTRATGEIVDLGNDFKGAVSDAIKKAAQAWGVLLYLSRKEDPIAALHQHEQAAAADEEAVEAGWASAAARAEQFSLLVVALNEAKKSGHDMTDIDAYFKAEAISSATITTEQYDHLTGLLDGVAA